MTKGVFLMLWGNFLASKVTLERDSEAFSWERFNKTSAERSLVELFPEIVVLASGGNSHLFRQLPMEAALNESAQTRIQQKLKPLLLEWGMEEYNFIEPVWPKMAMTGEMQPDSNRIIEHWLR